MGQLDWRGDEFIEHLTDMCSQRLDVAGEAVATNMRDLVSEPYPPASEPGESPHKRSGTLADGIKVLKPNPLVRRIASTAKYSIYLEFGTGERATDITKTKQFNRGFRQNAGMYRRPFMLKALMQSTGQIKQTVCAGELSGAV